jgi:hypothetical protein
MPIRDYNEAFFRNMHTVSVRSAEVVVPILVEALHPQLFDHTLAKKSYPETLGACLTAKKALMMLPALIRRSVVERLPS